jgi:chitin disaccharide deacetylase
MLGGPMPSSRARILIVNADDFGMTLPISRGIIEVCNQGIVHAASAMSNSPDFSQSIELLAASEASLDLGLHATLTWGKPLSDPSEVRSLVDRNGFFHPRSVFLSKALRGRISEKEVERELMRQASMLAERIGQISHLDGHHHVHVFPSICRVAARVARAFNIPYVRAPREGAWSPWYWAPMQRLAISLFPASAPTYWRRRGLQTTDHFGGYALSAGMRLKEWWLETIARLQQGVTEIMAHPGHASAGNGDIYDAGREEEISHLTDPELRDAVKYAGVELASFPRPVTS